MGNPPFFTLFPAATNHLRIPNSTDYKFSYFFVPNTDALWNGSKITLTHSYRIEKTTYNEKKDDYEKKSTRWAPRYENRPARHIAYIGVSSCVPQIELEKREVRINYTTSTRTDTTSQQVLQALSIVFNRRYDELNEHIAGKKKYGGVKSIGIRYSSLSMGAGEQRLLHVLNEVFTIPRSGLILIDELDILLHGDALERFIKVIHNRAKDKNLQIIFTSHREQLLDCHEFINIRHLHNVDGSTTCLNETKPDALRRMTGIQQRPLEILVEDDLATAIVNKVAGGLGMKKYVETTRFGAAVNSFTVISGMVLKGDDLTNSLCVLDGDEYRSDTSKDAQVKKVLTGDQQQDIDRRSKVLSVMKDFVLPEGEHPEKYIHSLVIGLDETILDAEAKELVALAKEIQVPQDKHDYINQLIIKLGYEKREGLRLIIDLVAKSTQWGPFVAPLKEWLESKKGDVMEQGTAAEKGTA